MFTRALSGWCLLPSAAIALVRKKLLVAVAAAALALAPTLAMAAEGSTQFAGVSRTGTGQVAQIEVLPEECKGVQVGETCVHEGIIWLVLAAGLGIAIGIAASGGDDDDDELRFPTTTVTVTGTGTATSTITILVP